MTLSETIFSILGICISAYLLYRTINPKDDFQKRCLKWHKETFGENEYLGIDNRRCHFLEESLELFQASGGDVEMAHQLVEYVFNRPSGEVFQEVGGVTTTLAVFCSTLGIEMTQASEQELARINQKKHEIRKKNLAKKHLRK